MRNAHLIHLFWLGPVAAFMGVFLVVGCSTISPPKVSQELAGVDPLESWARVLKQYVDEVGRVDFQGLSKNRAPLEAYVAYIANTPASNFTNSDDRLAHYLNSYNALAMYNILDYGMPDSLSGLTKVRIFVLRKFIIGGERMSLYAYENDIIRKLEEERVHFALNCMVRGCPRLPQVAFHGKTIHQDLERLAHFFLNEGRNVEMDHEAKVVRFNSILKFYTEDFLKKAPTLPAYTNKYRHEKIPEDYEVDFIPYDWSVNFQVPGAT